MDATSLVIFVVVAAVLLAAAYFVMSQRKKSAALKERFGPEYEHALKQSSGKMAAEKELAAREARIQRLHLKEIPTGQRDAYTDQWKTAQLHFVDDPSGAIGEADHLVQVVMDARGYPITNFEQQAADISVDHAEVVSNYRAAHRVAEANKQHAATTEDLRQAMVHYRSLFAELLGAKIGV